MKLRDTIHDCESQRLAQRVAKLEEKLFGAIERIAQLEEQNAQLRDENIQLREENARLRQQLATARKDSSTSSKPPSSDMVKPPKPPHKDRKKRKRGGQPGHEQHLRSPFPPEAVNHFEPYRPRLPHTRLPNRLIYHLLSPWARMPALRFYVSPNPRLPISDNSSLSR